jgi:ADP-heptose:LPS heptosyltransferase
VGNQIITSSLVVALAEHRPEMTVHYLAPAGKTDLVEGLPGLAKVHELPRHPWRRLGALWRLIRTLRRERFDVAIDASHWHSFSLTAALLARCCGAQWTIGHRRPGSAGLLDQWVTTPQTENWPSELQTKMRLLEPLGVVVESPRMALPSVLAGDQVQRWWAEHARHPHRVVLWPTTRKTTTEIPAGMWPSVLQGLPFPNDLSVAVGWGPGEEGLAEQLVRALQGEGFEAAALPPTTIPELGAFMAEADVVVSGDTGPLHLAGAVADQVYGIFRRPDGRRWLPPGEQHRGFVLSDQGDLEEMRR